MAARLRRAPADSRPVTAPTLGRHPRCGRSGNAGVLIGLQLGDTSCSRVSIQPRSVSNGVVVRDAAFRGFEPGPDDDVLDRNWRFARGVAAASAGLSAALGGALHVFAGVGATPLVAGAAVTAIAIGSRLPAAAPRRLRQHLSV